VIPLVVPWTNLRSETFFALADEGARYVDVSGSDDSYFWLLSELWEGQQGAIIVEHDVVPPSGSIASLRACERLWCGQPYLVGKNWDSSLGCVKFAPELMTHFPDTVDRVENTHWRTLDGQIIGYLRPKLGYGAHLHWPAARHLNDCGDESRVLANCGDCGAPIRFAEARGGPNTVRCVNGHWVNYFSKG
jgi:hypothetical protein